MASALTEAATDAGAAAATRTVAVSPPTAAAGDAQVTTLPCGVRVASERVDGVRSIALGFWIRCGSRDESEELAGVSHFLEHLLFKGSARYSSREIDELFDALGAEANAGTGKETTSVYARFLDRHLERAFDVLQDMVLRPVYAEVDSERQVILEEIAMYEDEPQDRVHDLLARALFADHPLGRPILGRAEVIANVPVAVVGRYHDERYRPRNVVVAAAGSVDHGRLCELVEQAFADQPPEPGPTELPADAPAHYGASVRFQRKDTEQFHVCVGAPGLARGDERRFALRVLDTILGGSSSSRLFQEVREKRGLAYSVYSYASQFVDCGQAAIYVGTRPDRVTESLEVIGRELRRLVEEGITDDELERARENAKGRTVLAMESTLARMNRLGGSLLTGVPLLSLDEILERYDAVTADDVVALAGELWQPDRLVAAAIGRDEEVWRRGLEALAPALAEAAAQAAEATG